MDTCHIKEIFELYEYHLLKETNDYIVFSEGHSMYPGIEIVCLNETEDEQISSLKADFSSQGYAVRICKREDIPHIEDYLFNWFFRVEKTNNSINTRYKQYGEAVINAYGLSGKHKPYEYIPIPYKVENNLFETKDGQIGNLIPSIRKDLESKGPRLIIVEAAAGFGKTSTAMELLHSYAGEKHNVRPFYMELYKDRQASIFRYLFLSQVHREFEVLLDDKIVSYNIEQGRIPLIIDGFDELLSEDLDTGNIVKGKRKGETMLSTIADLLKNNAKIVLTTRKTAILSGSDFLDWYQSRFGDSNTVQIVRYILGQPMLENWLSSSRIKQLSDKIINISNPVLLGYLHYLNDEQFASEAKSSNLMANYVKRLLEREIRRQGLTLAVNEQKVVYERLAVAFVYENITSDTRSNIRDDIRLFCSDILERHETTSNDSDSLANTLTNHALLDRKGTNNIGFINDFVLGMFLGYAIIDEAEKDLIVYYRNMSENFVEKLINAMSIESQEVKDNVWLKLHDNCPNISVEKQLFIDLKLMNQNMRSYNKHYFEGYDVSNSNIGNKDAEINSCHFVNFNFRNVNFNMDYITDCTFINCTFSQTELDTKKGGNDFFSCIIDGHDLSNEVEFSEKIEEVDNHNDNEEAYLIKMLSHYFQVDDRTRKMKMISKLKLDFDDNKSFKRIFSKLVSNGYIYTNGDKTHITDAGVDFYNKLKCNNGK
mgnify:FL=1